MLFKSVCSIEECNFVKIQNDNFIFVYYSYFFPSQLAYYKVFPYPITRGKILHKFLEKFDMERFWKI